MSKSVDEKVQKAQSYAAAGAKTPSAPHAVGERSHERVPRPEPPDSLQHRARHRARERRQAEARLDEAQEEGPEGLRLRRAASVGAAPPLRQVTQELPV